MSTLLQLNIHNIRNLEDVSIEPGPTFNVICGNNGSGKTSLLEAIHFLGFGRSFRTRLHNRVINYNQTNCTVFAKIENANTRLSVGVSKNRNGGGEIKLAGAPTTLNSVADLLPLQLIYPDGHKLLNGGPTYRRQFLDWGVFHVEHSFFNWWQRAQRAIKQRNQLLKEPSLKYTDISIWDNELINVSPQINLARRRFLEYLIPIISELLEAMELDLEIDFNYYPGWDDQKELLEILKADFYKDRLIGHTQHGPHKANLSLITNGKPIHDVLSQGQQKMVTYALKLGQSKLLQDISNKSSIYLLDDLPAELDPFKRRNLTRLMSDLASQVFITGIEPDSLSSFCNSEGARMFHVERGKVTSI